MDWVNVHEKLVHHFFVLYFLICALFNPLPDAECVFVAASVEALEVLRCGGRVWGNLVVGVAGRVLRLFFPRKLRVVLASLREKGLRYWDFFWSLVGSISEWARSSGTDLRRDTTSLVNGAFADDESHKSCAICMGQVGRWNRVAPRLQAIVEERIPAESSDAEPIRRRRSRRLEMKPVVGDDQALIRKSYRPPRPTRSNHDNPMQLAWGLPSIVGFQQKRLRSAMTLSPASLVELIVFNTYHRPLFPRFLGLSTSRGRGMGGALIPWAIPWARSIVHPTLSRGLWSLGLGTRLAGFQQTGIPLGTGIPRWKRSSRQSRRAGGDYGNWKAY